MTRAQSGSIRSSERNYGIDELRIISMMMIISLHFFSYNPSATNFQIFSPAWFARIIILVLCRVSVNCYILITGFYIFKTRFKFKKFLELLAEVLFYSVTIYLLMVFSGAISFSLNPFICSFLPTLTRQYWFVTSYVGAYLCQPILRNILSLLSKEMYRISLLLGFLLFVVYYNLFFFCDNLNFGGGTGIVWFLYLFAVGGYVARFSENKHRSRFYAKRYVLMFAIAVASEIPFYILYFFTKKQIFIQGATIFVSVYNSIFIFIMSVIFFEIFRTRTFCFKYLWQKKLLIFLSSGSFAVYLIHDNNSLRDILWWWIGSIHISNVLILLLVWFVTVLSIYLVASMIDGVRRVFFNYVFSSQAYEIFEQKCLLKISSIKKRLIKNKTWDML